MSVKIRKWTLALLTFSFIGLFIYLGLWQLSRAEEKKLLMKTFAHRTQQNALAFNNLNPADDLRFYRAVLHGRFDNDHTVLLDNKILNKQIGYEVYTPFILAGKQTTVLIDRGFIPAGTNRAVLPTILQATGNRSIIGMLNVPPAFITLGKMRESAQLSWPLRVQYIQLNELAKLMKQPLFPYIVSLSSNDPAVYAIKWQVITMPPERHTAYAVQWFALALTLLLLFAAFIRRLG